MKDIEKLDLEIRHVTPDDFDLLTDISRICFPEQFRWRIAKPKIRKFWGNLINSQSCEIWVCSVYGKANGFVALAYDRIKYQDAWDKKRFTFFDCLHIFMSCPKQSINRIIKKLKSYKAIKIKNPELSENENLLNTYKKIRSITSKSNPWCGPIAVLPDNRGNGISVKLMEHCFQRARSLGYEEIYSAVEKKNIMSRILNSIVGFKVTEEVGTLLFFKKTLENNNDK